MYMARAMTQDHPASNSMEKARSGMNNIPYFPQKSGKTAQVILQPKSM